MKKKKRAEEAKYKIHPVAAMFPMMADDELNELAADIKTNGQQFPIIRDDDEVVLDGRNRLEACRRADVEPKFAALANGQDPVAFIMSANIERRSLNQGQRAMITAMAYPEKASIGGKREKGKSSQIICGASAEFVRQARTVLEKAPDLADNVRIGAVALNDAYEEVRTLTRRSESRETRLAELHRVAPDYARKVTEDGMDLDEAEAAARERERKRQEQLAIKTRNLESALQFATTEGISADKMAREYDDVLKSFDAARLSLAAKTMSIIAQRRKEVI